MFIKFISRKASNDLYKLDLRNWSDTRKSLYGVKYYISLRQSHKGSIKLVKLFGDHSSLGTYRPISL